MKAEWVRSQNVRKVSAEIPIDAVYQKLMSEKRDGISGVERVGTEQEVRADFKSDPFKGIHAQPCKTNCEDKK